MLPKSKKAKVIDDETPPDALRAAVEFVGQSAKLAEAVDDTYIAMAATAAAVADKDIAMAATAAAVHDKDIAMAATAAAVADKDIAMAATAAAVHDKDIAMAAAAAAVRDKDIAMAATAAAVRDKDIAIAAAAAAVSDKDIAMAATAAAVHDKDIGGDGAIEFYMDTAEALEHETNETARVAKAALELERSCTSAASSSEPRARLPSRQALGRPSAEAATTEPAPVGLQAQPEQSKIK
jgi:hypothetical protein